jgi:hypothetical protein
MAPDGDVVEHNPKISRKPNRRWTTYRRAAMFIVLYGIGHGKTAGTPEI